MKKYFAIFILISILILSMQQSNAVPAYVGVKIDNLTDDSAHSCAGESGYGSQGRIRAIAAILPTYPIYFNLSRTSDGATIWSGDGIEDTDYTIGDTIYIPDSIDLTIGEEYNFFFDIDAIKVYLPLRTYGSFTKTDNDTYYINGIYGSSAGYWQKSNADGCNDGGSISYVTGSLNIYNSRALTTSSKITTNGGNLDFRINEQYYGLNTAAIGNFNFAFTMS
jgi:hypothetical protein